MHAFFSAMLFLGLAWLVTSCGKPKDPEVEYAPPPAAADPAFDKIKPIIQKNCGKCHGVTQAPKFDSAAAFKGSKAKARLQAGTMPPNGAAIDAGDKKALLAYLGG